MTEKKNLSVVGEDIWHRLVGAMLSGIGKEIRAATAAVEAAHGWPQKAEKKVRRKSKGARLTKRKGRAA